MHIVRFNSFKSKPYRLSFQFLYKEINDTAIIPPLLEARPITMHQLILGGARSGKSRLAQELAQDLEKQGKKVVYIATAERQHDDDSMSQRIQLHQQQRPSHWQTLECPLQLAECLEEYANDKCSIIVDCLTLWLSNCLIQWNNKAPSDHGERLLQSLNSLDQQSSHIIFVSNEVGLGVIPMGQLSRDFVDHSGFLHQALAQHCQRVIFTAAGLPLVMKGPSLTQANNN